MKKYLFFIVMCFNILSIFSQEITPEIKEIKNRNKKFKEIIETKYRVKDPTGDMKKIFFEKNITRYDESGKEIEWLKYKENNELEFKIIYVYNEKGLEIEWKRYKSETQLDSIYRPVYNEKDIEVEWIKYNLSNEIECKFIPKYNFKDGEIEWSKYDKDNNFLYKYSSKYDNRGNRIRWNKYDSSGKLEFYTIYKYDTLDNISEQNDYKGNGELISKFIFINEYDKYNKISTKKYLKIITNPATLDSIEILKEIYEYQYIKF